MTNTKLGIRWKACFFSILSVSPYLLFMVFYIKFQDETDFLYILTLMFVYGLPAYTLYSLIGWLFVGMPIHHLIQRYTSSGVQYYVFASLLLCLLAGFGGGRFSIIVFGIPIILQSVVFWFFWKKYNFIG